MDSASIAMGLTSFFYSDFMVAQFFSVCNMAGCTKICASICAMATKGTEAKVSAREDKREPVYEMAEDDIDVAMREAVKMMDPGYFENKE